jgi:serine protease Do
MVSAKGRSGFFLRYEDYIQTDAPINPGNSGGALVDAQGRLIGLNTFIVSRTGGSSGVNFAVPSNLARFVLERVVQDGVVKRGYLGVELEEAVSADLAREFDLPNTQGTLVTRVVPSGPASKAGVQAGDFIVEFNGAPVTDRRSLQFAVAKTSPGTEADFQVIRKGKPLTLTITLGELNLADIGRQRPRPESGPAEVLEGVEMVNLNDATRQRLNIPEDVEGNVLVTQVAPDSAAAKAGLAEGCIILEANHTPVESVADITGAARQTQRGRLLLRVRDPNGIVRFLVVAVAP